MMIKFNLDTIYRVTKGNDDLPVNTFFYIDSRDNSLVDCGNAGWLEQNEYADFINQIEAKEDKQYVLIDNKVYKRDYIVNLIN